MSDLVPLPASATSAERRARYAEVRARLDSLLGGEVDFVACVATVACELHHAFAAFHWTGFYRRVGAEELLVGPYQGGHGCVRIPFSRGVCGAAARTGRSQLVPDVRRFPDHISCSGSTQSELVVPVFDREGEVLAVLDLDSDLPAAFDATDQEELEGLCAWLGSRFPPWDAGPTR